MSEYNSDFYNHQGEDSYRSAIEVLPVVLGGMRQPPRSLLDVGCGLGTWAAAGMMLGISEVTGVDGDYVPEEQLHISTKDFIAADLGDPNSIVLPRPSYDLITCLEVAEHVSHEKSDELIRFLVGKGNLILFSAAIPYQGGTGHINENWVEYWQSGFARYGFRFHDLIRPLIWNNPDVCWWYRQNLFLVSHDSSGKFWKFGTYNPFGLASLIHPECFLNAIHRKRELPNHSKATDLQYLKSLTTTDNETKDLHYGLEYSKPSNFTPACQTLDELRSWLAENDNPVLKDAISPIKPATNPGSHLSKAFLNPEHLPDFLCIGVQKAATTWLYQFLHGHEAVWMPGIKELNFFNSLAFNRDSAFSGSWRRKTALERLRQAINNNPEMDQRWLESLVYLSQPTVDLDWYAKIFSYAPQGRIKGEITPEYSMLPLEMIQSIKRLKSDLKIILILRNPKERLASQLGMMKSNMPGISDQVLTSICGLSSPMARSEYKRILENWLSVFTREQFLILDHAVLEQNPKDFAHKITDFLGITPSKGIRLSERVNPTSLSVSQELIPVEAGEKLDKEWTEIRNLYLYV